MKLITNDQKMAFMDTAVLQQLAKKTIARHYNVQQTLKTAFAVTLHTTHDRHKEKGLPHNLKWHTAVLVCQSKM